MSDEGPPRDDGAPALVRWYREHTDGLTRARLRIVLVALLVAWAAVGACWASSR